MSMSSKTTPFLLELFYFGKYSLRGSLKKLIFRQYHGSTSFKKHLTSQVLPKISILVNVNLKSWF